MNHQQVLSRNSPLSPKTPKKTSPSNFSPKVSTCLKSSKRLGLSSSTPDVCIISPPMISPIKSLNSSDDRAPSGSDDIDMDSFAQKMESFSIDDDCNNSLNESNINNRQLNVSTILDDLGIQQYKELFETQEIDMMTFFLLTDEDLIELGVSDQNHREIMKNAIRLFCGV